MGPLSVLYFKDYHRFVLHLNDWRYPLMRRLPVTSEKGEGNSRVYEFPALNGFFYRLRFNNAYHSSSLSNFESILGTNSNFYIKGVESPLRKLEVSPDDKLVRHRKEKESGPTEMIKEVIKQSYEKVKHATESLKTGTKNLISRKQKTDLKNIKNKNFRKNAKCSFKKDFFLSGEKLSKEFVEKRRGNPNLSETKDYKDLLKTSDNVAPSLYLWKVEIEESILNNKDLIKQGDYKLSDEQIEKRGGIISSIKQGLHDIKESVTGMMHEKREETRGRDMKPSTIGQETEPKTGMESMHYQG